MKAAIISFTKNGENTAKRVMTLFAPGEAESCRCESGGLYEWTKEHFNNEQALIFVGACGIAVRAIAPFIRSKAEDPAVIVIDEKGTNIIPILSGHIGNANLLSIYLSEKMNANAVITTATDINGITAIDSWAVENGMVIKNKAAIKAVSAKALEGETIRIKSDIAIRDVLPEGTVLCDESEDVYISYKNIECSGLIIIPKVLTVGIGCRRGKSAEELESFVEEIFSQNGLETAAIKNIASIDIKKNESGIISLAEKYGAEMKFYSSDELNAAAGEFSSSAFVKEVTGTDNVCERSAYLGSGGGEMLAPKRAGNGITLAIAIEREAMG